MENNTLTMSERMTVYTYIGLNYSLLKNSSSIEEKQLYNYNLKQARAVLEGELVEDEFIEFLFTEFKI